MYQYIGNSMSKNKSALFKKITKPLMIGLPIIALSGLLPGMAGIVVSSASADIDDEEITYQPVKSDSAVSETLEEVTESEMEYEDEEESS